MKKTVLFLYAAPLLLIGMYVPVRIEGFNQTFWVFFFDFNKLGEQGILWHCYKIVQNLDWRYFFAELFIAYSLFFGIMFYIKRDKGTKGNGVGAP